jgi:predicted nucleic acid-binding protein
LPAARRKERVFLDANLLFSAAYLPDSGLRRLWRLNGVELLSSSYAVAEARRNLREGWPEALDRLDELLKSLKLVEEAQDQELPGSVRVDAKDKPILLAAIRGGSGHLLTGDKRHFGHLYGKIVKGVSIGRPADYLLSRQRKRRSP